MSYNIRIGPKTYSFVDMSQADFRHISFQRGAPENALGISSISPDKLDKCPHYHDRNPDNDCSRLGPQDLVAAWNAGFENRQAAMVDAMELASERNDFQEAITGLQELKAYARSMEIAFEKKALVNSYMRGFSYGLQDKKRCCQNNSTLDKNYEDANDGRLSAKNFASEVQNKIAQIEKQSAAYYEEGEESANYQLLLADTNAMIAETRQIQASTEFNISKLAASEGSTKILYVAMAVVAAFFVYRFVIKR